MEHWLERTWAEIDLDALLYNYRQIRAVTAPQSRIMAVIKADAYGHGAVEVAHTLGAAGADWFGVSNLEEGIQLRKAGISQPILILSYTPPEEAARLAQYRITQAVIHAEHGRRLEEAAARAGVTVDVHLKVDTGMTRVGFPYPSADPGQTLDEMEAICRLPHLRAEGIFTHFAVSDEEDGEAFTRRQYACFTEAVQKLAGRGITFALRHCCNSAAVLRFPEMHLDMVRPGLILYGLTPAAFLGESLGLRPVMALKTRVSMVKTVAAGETVSYGRTYTAPREMRIATVPIGYADGYSRRLSNRGYMLIHGQKAPVIGRVCMDQCMLDVTDIPGVHEETQAVVFGEEDGVRLPVETFAAWSDTIHYEAVCEIGKRVPRLFLKRGEVVGQLNYVI